MFGLGPTELIIIAIILLLLFGAKRIPEIGKGIGGAIKEFKKVKKEISLDENNNVKENKKAQEEKEEPAALEARIADKISDQIPGIKKVREIKKKADKIKKLM